MLKVILILFVMFIMAIALTGFYIMATRLIGETATVVLLTAILAVAAAIGLASNA